MDVQRSHNPKDIGFTVIISSVIEDERLRNGALEVLVYLLSKPPGWVIRPADLKRRFGYGDKKMRAVYRCLEEARYLMRERVNGEGGRIAWHHSVYDLPQDPEFDPYGHRRKSRKKPPAEPEPPVSVSAPVEGTDPFSVMLDREMLLPETAGRGRLS